MNRSVLAATLFALAPMVPAWGNSCLLQTAAAAQVEAAKLKSVDAKMSVLRPCQGRVKASASSAVEVLFTTASGNVGRASARAGEGIQDVVKAALPQGSQLADIWPEREILAALSSWVSGKVRSTISGSSGFETPPNAPPLHGPLVPLEGLALPLGTFGWSSTEPVTLSQRGWSVVVQPTSGLLVLPVARMAEGEIQLAQVGKSPAKMHVVPAAELRVAREQMEAIDRLDTSPASKSVLRAAWLQSEQYPVNAIAEYIRGQRP